MKKRKRFADEMRRREGSRVWHRFVECPQWPIRNFYIGSKVTSATTVADCCQKIEKRRRTEWRAKHQSPPPREWWRLI